MEINSDITVIVTILTIVLIVILMIIVFSIYHCLGVGRVSPLFTTMACSLC